MSEGDRQENVQPENGISLKEELQAFDDDPFGVKQLSARRKNQALQAASAEQTSAEESSGQEPSAQEAFAQETSGQGLSAIESALQPPQNQAEPDQRTLLERMQLVVSPEDKMSQTQRQFGESKVKPSPSSQTPEHPPINPYSLVEAVNASSDTAHVGWLIFLGIMAYLMIAVAGVTHTQLLLQTDVELPILNVKIPQAQFFQFAPIFFLLFHLGLISQLALLARKTLELDKALGELEPAGRRTHPLRLELNNFFFVQGVAGPVRSLIMSLFLHAMSWLTLVVLPVVLLLFIQLSFLPFHDSLITWTHRIVLVLDIAVLVTIGVFLNHAETSFFRAFLRSGSGNPIGFVVTFSILGAVLFFSFFIATIPGKTLDRVVNGHIGSRLPFSAHADAARAFAFGSMWGGNDGALFGLFYRNLIVQDVDFVVDRDVSRREISVSLRGRDLRFARLDRSDLHQADLTGANLDGASLVGTNLQNARFGCADENELLFGGGRKVARCASARGANFVGAILPGSKMTGMDLTRAKFENANLEDATLKLAVIGGADFSNANLRKADFSAGVQGQGAIFLIAQLEGADFNGAQLQYADFSNAQLQAANLSYAQLQGAILRDAFLNGAVLYKARLNGADLTRADISGVDFREALVWQATPPANPGQAFKADMRGLNLIPMTTVDRSDLEETLGGIASLRVRKEVVSMLKPVLSTKMSDTWKGSPGYVQWRALIGGMAEFDPDVYRADLTAYLTKLACKTRWQDGAVAYGVVRRAKVQGFVGDLIAIYDRLKASGEKCLGAGKLDPAILNELALRIDAGR